MSLDGLIVREATVDDHAFLAALEQQVIGAERPYNASLKEKGAYYYDIKKLIFDSDSRLVVGEVSGDIIATGYVRVRHSKPSLNHDNHGYLGFMYVAEEYRGLGLNQVIMQDLVSWGSNKKESPISILMRMRRMDLLFEHMRSLAFGALCWK